MSKKSSPQPQAPPPAPSSPPMNGGGGGGSVAPPLPPSPSKTGGKLKATSQEWTPSPSFLHTMETYQPEPQFSPHITYPPLKSQELEGEVRRQLEVLFSNESLFKDRPLLRKLKGGTSPVDYIANLPIIRRLTSDRHLLLHAMRSSTLLYVSRDGRRVGRKDLGLTEAAYKLVELIHLSPDATVDTVMATVGRFGPVAHVDVYLEDEEAVARGVSPPFQQALVEFADAEHALQCVESLSGSLNWRTGLRVAYHNGMSAEHAAKHVRKGKVGGGKLAGTEETKQLSAHQHADGGDVPSSPGGHTTLIPPSLAEGVYKGQIGSIEGSKGVIKRDGRRSALISFDVPAGKELKAGDFVEYVIVHVNGKVQVNRVTKIQAPAPPTTPVEKKNTGAAIGTCGPKAHYILAKGPDGSKGFALPRTALATMSNTTATTTIRTAANAADETAAEEVVAQQEQRCR